MIWKQEPIEETYIKIKKTLAYIDIKCINITFRKYNPIYGTIGVDNIQCEYLGSNKELLNDLMNDEVYILRKVASIFLMFMNQS